MGLVGWLVTIGGLLLSAGVGVWGFTDVSKTAAIWALGVPGAVILVIAAGLDLQKYALSEQPIPTVATADRAYVFVVEADVLHPIGHAPVMTIVIKNTGRTPATELTWRAKFEFRLVGDADKLELDPTAKGIEQIVPPEGVLSYRYAFPAWTDANDGMLRKEEAAIFAIGEIRYRDNAGIRRFTDYLLWSGGRFGIKSGVGAGKFGTLKIKSD